MDSIGFISYNNHCILSLQRFIKFPIFNSVCALDLHLFILFLFHLLVSNAERLRPQTPTVGLPFPPSTRKPLLTRKLSESGPNWKTGHKHWARAVCGNWLCLKIALQGSLAAENGGFAFRLRRRQTLQSENMRDR
jgi:hypothetical protein